MFSETGGLHAVGLFTPEGAPLLVREDVGRHNAVDKVIGARLRGGFPSLAGAVMLLSGRAGFELVQKAAVARVPIVCSVSAPSALAIDLAEDVGMTLVGFVRGGSRERLHPPAPDHLSRPVRRRALGTAPGKWCIKNCVFRGSSRLYLLLAPRT